MLRANKAHAVPLDGRNRKFAVSYHVEGNELGKRRYHVDQFEVSKRASKVRLHMRRPLSTTLLLILYAEYALCDGKRRTGKSDEHEQKAVLKQAPLYEQPLCC